MDDEIECFNTVEPQQGLSSAGSNVHGLMMWFVHLLALLQKKHYIPDTAIDFLLKLLAVFFTVLRRLYPEISPVVDIFPGTIYQMRQFLKLGKGTFVRYVTCPKCSKVYKYDDCVETCGRMKKSKPCRLCGSQLLKTVQTCSGAQLLYPIRTYCYRPLRESLQLLLDRPGFYSDCEKWRYRQQQSAMLTDIFDGKIWHDFQDYNGKPFLREPFTYGLMINVDWFKAYKHTEYKMGAIYLTVMNLPRELRFRQENMILVGLIPGPGEPSLNINSFLSPLVDELLEFLDGIPMKVCSISTPQIVKCALLCVACDMPASRKVSGFLGHTATLGCTRCLKIFPGSFGQKDYSGFDRSLWPSRSNEEHRRDVKTIVRCTSKTSREKKESELGCRYSILLKLPYFDPIRMTIIDPMHNLYLGTAKHILKSVWLEQDLITKKQLESIQSRVDSVHVPSKVGRIPSKIASSFSGFTADQFKNWTNIYSLFALYDILPTEDFECWKHFVLASRLLNHMHISFTDVQLADALLLQFCKRVERMYGTAIITPNMHMHCHLKQCILDYGPIYSFWLFSFERYNGIFESFPTNSCSVEVQCMQRFVHEFSVSTASLPQSYQPDFNVLIQNVDPVVQGSVKATLQPFCPRIPLQELVDWTKPTSVVLPQSYILAAFDQACLSELQSMYTFLYPNFAPSDLTIHSAYRKYSKLEYCGVTYKSERCHPGRPSIVFVQQYCPSQPLPTKPSAVIVHFFVRHSITIHSEQYDHVLLCVSWLKQHVACDALGKPLQIWWKDLFQSNMFSFIPVQYILGECACMDIKYEEQSVLLMCPIQFVSQV